MPRIALSLEESEKLHVLYAVCTSRRYAFNEHTVYLATKAIIYNPENIEICFRWIHDKIHTADPSTTPSMLLFPSDFAVRPPHSDELLQEILKLVGGSPRDIPASPTVAQDMDNCIHNCPFVAEDSSKRFSGEADIEQGDKGWVRTVTEFCLTDEWGNHTAEIGKATYLYGLCGSMNLHTPDGQKLSMGVWRPNTETAWMRVRMHSLKPETPAWHRDGKTSVTVATGTKAAYVLQKPCAQFRSCWESAAIFANARFAELNVQTADDLPQWVLRSAWRSANSDSYKRKAMVVVHDPPGQGTDKDADSEPDPFYNRHGTLADQSAGGIPGYETPPLEEDAVFAGRSL
ncbi:hypothetical protein FRC11_010203 [Ceratobasidium sp. 423]|nr:hypothetical protein FRC11_010203 [Ceratobasidium sp. 423]